ncbi:MAG: membrane-binding protein [Ardenticatenaceae bacterium]|nr:membrane-binding protein [Ardenticatenaceae bacterium]MCB8989461.1 membrane-binding protein [Ardenticatenaceae bacterium]MCB9005001.1 membrane-binding protein [Ardenticatenaceae bacterium]
MAYVPFSQSVSNFRTMASGITTRLDSLTGVGITAVDATAMEKFADELDALNSEQEDIKAQLKTKTEELNAKMKEARAKNANLAKRIKLATPQEHWAAFGITAKR